MSKSGGAIRSEMGTVVGFFRPRRVRLETPQQLTVECRKLIVLARRSLYWLIVMLVASCGVIFLAGRQQMIETPPQGMGIQLERWASGIWLMALPYCYLLYKTIKTVGVDGNAATNKATLEQLGNLQFLWIVWCSSISLWWMFGAWSLAQPPARPEGTGLVLTMITFFWLTVLGHIFTVIFLASHVRALWCAIIFGVFFPLFVLYIDTPAKVSAASYIQLPFLLRFLSMEGLALCIIGFFIYKDRLQGERERAYAEAQSAQADLKRTEAQAAEKRADQERAKAQEARERAELERMRTDQERAKADAARERAEAERTKADEERARADQERAKFQEARERAEAERAKADEARERAEAERAKADEERTRADQECAKADEARERAEGESARAEKALRDKNTFIGSISHDLRGPIASLGLTLHTLRRKLKDNPALATYASVGLEQNADLQRMIDGAFDLSRLAAGSWKVDVRELAAANQILERVVSSLQADAEKKGFCIRMHAASYMVRSDSSALERIVRNLIQNAIRYTPERTNPDDPKRDIVVGSRRYGNWLRLSVMDRGIGIPEDRLDDIFNEYVQVDNDARDRSKGFGLGLAIVKGLANLLDHRLEVRSKVGRGSRFSIFVPIVGRIRRDPIDPVKDQHQIEGMTVLLVEDDVGLRAAQVDHLEDLGCRVIDGDSAEAIIAKLAAMPTCKPDFALADYRLPNGNGVEAIRAIRAATTPSLPAAIWSGETSVEAQREAMEYGLEILRKGPLEPLHSILAKHRPPL